MKLIKENEKGKNYQADGFKITYRYKGAITENAVNLHEILFLITGKVKVTINDKTETIEAPARIEIPAKTYHKIEALTDIACVLFEYDNQSACG